MEEMNLAENIVVLTLNQIGVDVLFSNTMMEICVPLLCALICCQ